jgi:hypothetical protein
VCCVIGLFLALLNSCDLFTGTYLSTTRNRSESRHFIQPPQNTGAPPPHDKKTSRYLEFPRPLSRLFCSIIYWSTTCCPIVCVTIREFISQRPKTAGYPATSRQSPKKHKSPPFTLCCTLPSVDALCFYAPADSPPIHFIYNSPPLTHNNLSK